MRQYEGRRGWTTESKLARSHVDGDRFGPVFRPSVREQIPATLRIHIGKQWFPGGTEHTRPIHARIGHRACEPKGSDFLPLSVTLNDAPASHGDPFGVAGPIQTNLR